MAQKDQLVLRAPKAQQVWQVKREILVKAELGAKMAHKVKLVLKATKEKGAQQVRLVKREILVRRVQEE
jgi:hypothetical protein